MVHGSLIVDRCLLVVVRWLLVVVVGCLIDGGQGLSIILPVLSLLTT